MSKLATMTAPVRLFALRNKNALMLGAALALPVAGAQSAATNGGTPDSAGAAAVTDLGLGDMIYAFGSAVRTLVKDNGLELALVILPILAWYFIRNQLRGSV